jgi:hypothetical protein
MLHEQIEVVRSGGEPINVFRNPEENDRMELTIPGFQERPVVSLQV